MKTSRQRRMALSVLALACAPLSASASQVLFSDNFDSNTSSRYDIYSVDNEPATPLFGTPAAPGGDVQAQFNYNYGAYTFRYTDFDDGTTARTALIPASPGAIAAANGGTPTTTGLRLDVNGANGGTAIINLYPKVAQYLNGTLPTGDIKLTYDAWSNYNGGFQGGVGSTEWMIAGIDQAGGGIGGPVVGTATFPLKTGYALAISGEGQNGNDYRTYVNNTRFSGTAAPLTIADGGYVAPPTVVGTTNRLGDSSSNPFYQNLFPFPQSETPGSIGKQWVQIEMSYVDSIVYYKINGTLIAARTDLTTKSGHLMLGYGDFNSSSAAVDNITGIDANFVLYDNVVLQTVDQVRPTWNKPVGDVWSDSNNWLNGSPNGTEATADFTSAITTPQTINVDGGKTVRSITFNNANTYTLTGAAITLDSLTTGILGTITTVTGNHVIANDVISNRNLLFNTAANSSVTLTGNLSAAGKVLNKIGAGTVTLKSMNVGVTSLAAGTIAIAPNGTASGASVINTLAVTSGAKLDLNDNDLIVDYTGTSPLATIRALLVSAFNVGKWNGPGIGSTLAGTSASGLQGLGYSEASALSLGSIDNVTLDATAVIVKYTYYGDSNLDGKVDAADFTMFLDGLVGSGTAWIQGDYTYDGKVDLGNDFNLFLSSYIAQGSPLGDLVPLIEGDADLTSSQKAALLSVVPEPSSIGLLALAGASLMVRHKK